MRQRPVWRIPVLSFTIYKKLHPPYLMTTQPSMIDGAWNKSVSKKSMGTTINMVGMEDIERPLASTIKWKVALLKKKFISVLKL